MDSSKAVKLIKVKNLDELEVTTAGIQLLQSFSNPFGILSLIGPSKVGKSYLANKILDTQEGFKTNHSTKGIWMWSEPIKAKLTDESGLEKEGDLLLIDCQSVINSPKDLKKLSLKILTLVSLLSSHMLMLSSSQINTQTLKEVNILNEIPALIHIQKHQDCKQTIQNYLPKLTWVITGHKISEPENYLEKSLKPSDDESGEIKANLNFFYKKKDFFNLNFDSSNSANTSIGLLLSRVRDIEVKKINGKAVSGAVLCNMLQSYVHKLNKNSSVVISTAFERAVATEARRNKEKLFIKYIEKMTLLENDFPCDDEVLQKEHFSSSKELLKEFDLAMLHVFQQEEVQEERNCLLDRIQAYFEDLKTANLKSSDSKCRELFKSIFDPFRETGLQYLEDGTVSISELEQRFFTGVQSYQEAALGPCAELVLSEEISLLVQHMCGLLRELQNYSEGQKERLQKEVKSLTRHRDEARAGEKRLKDMLEEASKNHEKQLEQRSREISDLQSSVNSRVHAAETKARSQIREIQGLRLELEQAQKERDMMLEAERDIYEKRISDAESKVYKLQLENSKYERMLDDLREEQEKLIAEKNEQINDLSRKLKLIETQPDPDPSQDASVLRSFKDYLEDIFNKFSKEQNANAKYLNQLERVASLQNELNQVRIREQEGKSKELEEYEEKIKQFRSEHENETKFYNEAIEKQKEELRLALESVTFDIDNQNRAESEREEKIKRLLEERNELLNELAKREQQLADQYDVIDTIKKQKEQLQIERDDKDNQLNRIKIENSEERDDNQVLISLMSLALEAFQKKKNHPAIKIDQIQNHENRTKFAKLCKRFGISYEH